MKVLILLLILAALPQPAAGLDEALYAKLLGEHTREVADLARVRVDYPALARSPAWKALVASLSTSDPATLRTRDEQLAFWINAYNILAIDLVARSWPVASIRDIGSFFSPVWKREAGRIGGRPYSLDEIEHGIIRPMGDPRAHAAVVCASTSCPALRREPFRAASLDAELDDAMRTWMADPGKGLAVDRAANVIRLSRIFDWFEEDFTPSPLAFAARFAPDDARAFIEARGAAARVEYFDYDWAVNAIPTEAEEHGSRESLGLQPDREEAAASLRGSPKSGHPARRATSREVVGRLEVQPELRRGIESLCEQPCGLGRDASLAANQLVDALYWNAQMLGECHLRSTHRNEELHPAEMVVS